MKDNVTDTSALAVERLEKAGANIFGKINVPCFLPIGRATTRSMAPPTTLECSADARRIVGRLGGRARRRNDRRGRRQRHRLFDPQSGTLLWRVRAKADLRHHPLRRHALPGVFAPTDISIVGPLARGAADLDIMLDVMAGPDELDDACWRLDLPQSPATSLKDLRIAMKLSHANAEADSEYAGKLQALADDLARKGATVKEIERAIDTRRLHEIYVLLLRAATSGRTPVADMERWKAALAENGADKEPYLDQMVRGVGFSHKDWIALNNERHKLRFAFDAFFKDWDVLLCTSAALPHDQKGERWQRKITIDGKRVPTTDHLFWAGYSGAVYLPSIVGPIGLTQARLPVGYQAITAHGRDKTATAFSRLVEREIGGFVPPPGFG